MPLSLSYRSFFIWKKAGNWNFMPMYDKAVQLQAIKLLEQVKKEGGDVLLA